MLLMENVFNANAYNDRTTVPDEPIKTFLFKKYVALRH